MHDIIMSESARFGLKYHGEACFKIDFPFSEVKL